MDRSLPKHRAREYETIFILNPEIATDTMEQIAGRLTDVVSRLEGKLLRAENWGRRRLAYPVRKNQKGIYVYLRYLGYEDMVPELERNMRMLEPVIKYMTVKLDEDVNPEVRPVRDEDISFLPQFDEEPEPAHADEASSDLSDDTDIDDMDDDESVDDADEADDDDDADESGDSEDQPAEESAVDTADEDEE